MISCFFVVTLHSKFAGNILVMKLLMPDSWAAFNYDCKDGNNIFLYKSPNLFLVENNSLSV